MYRGKVVNITKYNCTGYINSDAFDACNDKYIVI